MLTLDEPNALDSSQVGGKAAGLARMRQSGKFSVPSGICLTATEARNIGPFVEGLLHTAIDAFGRDVRYLAVRSSAIAEDGAIRSFAGQFESKLGVTSEGLLDAISSVAASGRSERVEAYSGARQSEVCVIVQPMLNALSSGVMFTRHPVYGPKSSVVLIESCHGLGEPLVSGEITPDRHSYDRATNSIETTLGTQSHQTILCPEGVRRTAVPSRLVGKPSLSTTGIRQLGSLSDAIEETSGFVPQDVEWVIDRSGKLYVLQSRPITSFINPHVGDVT